MHIQLKYQISILILLLIIVSPFLLIAEDEFEEFEPMETSESIENNNESKSLDGFSTPGDSPGLKKTSYTKLYWSLGILLFVVIAGFMARYKFTRKFRGVFLLSSLIILGFYSGGWPGLISSFHEFIYLLIGIKPDWQDLIWFLLIIPLTYIFGKVWCGWICHLGALQEFIFFPKKYNLFRSEKAQNIMRIIRIILFITLIIQIILTKTNLLIHYVPFKFAFNLFSSTLLGYILLGLLLLISLFIYRPFCKTMCPIGLILGWTSKIPGASILGIDQNCAGCSICNDSCKMDAITRTNNVSSLNNQDCIVCGDCLDNCKKESISFYRKGKKHITKFKFKNLSVILIIIMFLFTAQNIKAQVECRSILGAHLTPIYKGAPLQWAIEGTMAPGKMTDYNITGGKILGALNFNFTDNFIFYIEGGYKNWGETPSKEDSCKHKGRHFGMRQIFGNFNTKTFDIKLGLQEMKLTDYFLVDEKVAGISIIKNIGALNLSARAGAVLNNFARMGSFCGNKQFYNIVTDNFTEGIGKKFGETSLFGISLNWEPAYKKQEEDQNKNEEGDNEFDEFSEFEYSEKNIAKKSIINEIGFLFYTEFGSIINNQQLYFGPFAHFIFPAEINLKLETVYQNMKNNNTLSYIIKIRKAFLWNSGANTELQTGYFGNYQIDNNALFMPRFSNLFIGEVVRLDTINFPISYASIKHMFPWDIKFFLKLKFIQEIMNNKTSELDFETGISLFHHAKITLILSNIESRALAKTVNMVRAEFKLAF